MLGHVQTNDTTHFIFYKICACFMDKKVDTYDNPWKLNEKI